MDLLFDYERNHDTPKELKNKQFRKKSITEIIGWKVLIERTDPDFCAML